MRNLIKKILKESLDKGQENFNKPKDFDDWIFVHQTPSSNVGSIQKNGFRPSSNKSITNGVYTIPLKWGQLELAKGWTNLYIKLIPGCKIFWTDSERPMDFYRGYGNKFYENLYNQLNDLDLSPRDADIKSNDVWHTSKEIFCRKIEKWLKENGYCGIQQGGEIVITDLSSIVIVDEK